MGNHLKEKKKSFNLDTLSILGLVGDYLKFYSFLGERKRERKDDRNGEIERRRESISS